jgi:hypothetical protein
VEPVHIRRERIIVSIFSKRRPVSEPDLVAYARAHVTSPGAHALLGEVERGRARRAAAGRARQAAAEDKAPSDSPRAHEITPDDAALIRAMSGARFRPDATITLPSGKTITGTEMQRWTEG